MQILLLRPLVPRQKRQHSRPDPIPHRFFGLSNGYWLRAQAAHDSEVAEREIGPALSRIRPWTQVVAQKNEPDNMHDS